MTAKKKIRPPSLSKQLAFALAGKKALEEQYAELRKQQLQLLEDRNPKDTCAEEPEPRYATPGGPNRATDVFAPGCGPMQLVWATADKYDGSCVLGWQCDSFRVFRSRAAAADWLRAQARRLEEWGGDPDAT
jgi:hypothetical protein